MTVHVLVVDPDPDLCRMVGVKLRQAGMAVTTRGDAGDVLALLTSQPVAAVVLDVSDAGAVGLGVCERIRLEPGLAHLPVLALTGRDRTADVVRAMRAGATGYLVKPFSPAELTARVLAMAVDTAAA